jgi:DNA repair exonuclease SbcCD ATPase subunit
MSEQTENRWDGDMQNGHPAPVTTSAATPASASAAREAEGGNVDKIRDILFGAQMRDYDRRFSGLEDRLLQEAATLRDEVARRLSATDQYVRGELDDLTSRLTTEQRERTQGIREAMDALTTVNRELSERISALAEQTAQQHRELRQSLAEHYRTLTDEGSRRHQELTTAMRREAADLRNAKTDRTALAAMFAEFAHRLSNEPDGR